MLCFVVKKNSYLIQEHHRHHRQPPYNGSHKHPSPQSRQSSKWP